MLEVGRPKAEIDDVHLILDCPTEGRFENLNRGNQAVGEDLHRKKRCLWSLEFQDSGERGSVPQGVPIVGGLQHLALWTGAESHTAGDRADVGVSSVDAAVNERDADAGCAANAYGFQIEVRRRRSRAT